MVEATKNLVERLFNEQRVALQAFLFRRVHRVSEASDLAQEAYVRMLGLPETDSIRNPEAYLYAVASNLAREHARREPRESRYQDIDDPSVQQQCAEEPRMAADIDAESRVERLREVLQQLPPKCLAAVELQYWHGMRYEDIAQRLGISTHMVKKYLSQALVHCRRRMARLR
jgi:RNA polymerase sigma factor (sigma-70 family)